MSVASLEPHLPVAQPHPPGPQEAADPLERALADLHDDLGELLFLCDAAATRLSRLEVELADACPVRATRDLLGRAATSARRRYRALKGQIHTVRGQARYAPRSAALLGRIAGERVSLADRLRAEQALVASIVAAPDWQSPSFLHSLAPAAGRQTGRIQAHWNDYKRDRHSDAETYERQYVEEMVDGSVEVRALLTGCGMAAFTTILAWLLGEGKLSGQVLAGRGIYHESRLLLERMLPGRIRFVDEADTPRLLRAIDDAHPSALFLDSLSNSSWMPMPDLGAVIGALGGTGTYLILDNTCLSVGGQPFALADESVRLVVSESLLKYAQFGLDRANAGVIVARSDDARSLDDYREHLGANIPDVAVHSLAPPDRGMLERRLERLQRNASHLAERLARSAPPDMAIAYPGIGAHHLAGAGGGPRFRGGCISVAPRGRTPHPEYQRRIVTNALSEAARRGVRLYAGSSFGFDTTRIYLAAARAEHGSPFVRIAAGTEHWLELDALSDVLAAAIGVSAGPGSM
ncbi:MAG: PLP-dependent transferase [Solirubrobacterales bacterium]|nr:PLP-dependent transferase [Solirubrobacterales bacterium]